MKTLSQKRRKERRMRIIKRAADLAGFWIISTAGMFLFLLIANIIL